MSKKIGIQVRMHQPALAGLRELSRVRGLPSAELIRRAVDEFLAKERRAAHRGRVSDVFEQLGPEANLPAEGR